MTGPVPQIIGVATKEIVDQAKALGLVWTLRLATIATKSNKRLTIVFDGDTVPISAENITGSPLASGDRVYCLIVPTIGNFIIGYGENTSPIGVIAVSTAQSIPNNSTTAVSWGSTSFNSSGFLGVLPSTSITIPSTLGGIYAITANTLLSAAGTRNFIEVSTNGSLFIRSTVASPETFTSVSGKKFLAGGTLVAANVFQNSGGPTNATSTIWLYRIG